MKRFLACLMLLMLFTPALAELDLSPLKDDPDWTAFPVSNSVNTFYRAANQPYHGQVDEGFDGELVAYVDYITLVDAGVTVPRLMLCTVAWDLPLNAQEVRLTVGKTRYTLAASHTESEYDGVYMEDYESCLVGDGLALLKTIAQQKTNAFIPVELLLDGSVVFSGQVIIPGEEAAQIYDRYIDMGGKTQNVKALEALWPVEKETIR
ncbi:MAG: hypothetical protein IJO39_03770 [Clostridia bacterium]|nr:hypothetical protein [Clostridia bacterium]